MTIPYAGVCIGSGKPPREGTLRGGDGQPVTGVCPACSGRIELRHDLLPEHEVAPEDERESVDRPHSETDHGATDPEKARAYGQTGDLGTGTQGDSIARELADRQASSSD
jgi:hypothetical protein